MIEHIAGFLTGSASYLIPFIIVLSIVVFAHEFGHFYVARRLGVKVEEFSIGFGPEIFGWNDKTGTHWRVAWIPLGGFVKMLGDADPSSFGPGEDVPQMSAEDRAHAFFTQSPQKRFAIAAAGPVANYAFALVILAVLFFLYGQPFTAPIAEKVVEGSAAAAAGILPGDKILALDGRAIDSFEDIKRAVTLGLNTPIDMTIERDGAKVEINVTPELVRLTDRLGFEHQEGRLGLLSSATRYHPLGIGAAVKASFVEVYDLTTSTLKGVGQMILGVRAADELGGPIRIAEMSGKVAKEGVEALALFLAIISVNLGLINLFPIPLLDGGHLVFYLLEMLRGKPLSEKLQEYGARTGAALVLALMLFATWNDLVHLRVISYLRGLLS